jgi:hypothetical protein
MVKPRAYADGNETVHSSYKIQLKGDGNMQLTHKAFMGFSVLLLAIGLAMPTPAIASKKAKNTVGGAVVGAGVGYLVGGKKGAAGGALVGAIAGARK